MGGMPPAFIFAVGCLKSSASWSGENFAFMPTSAGAAAVPTPASPWHALQDCASKMVFPFAANGSASVTFAAARDAEESSGANGLREYSSFFGPLLRQLLGHSRVVSIQIRAA